MPRKAYTERLSDSDIIELFRIGKYQADLETGQIFSERTAAEVFVYEGSRTGLYLYVRLYDQPKHRALPVAHVIWMLGANHPIPRGWQIHHRDTVENNNAFTNLVALHPIDHLKLHSKYDPTSF